MAPAEPDGYTRWFNPGEFDTPGLFGYTPGIFASSGYTGTATLCPYKYFADGLGATDDLWAFLNANSAQHGVFSSGSTNWRKYYMRFPLSGPGVEFGYAILANWESETVHPSNASEAVACSVTIKPDLHYVDSSDKGGSLILDFSLFDWDSPPVSTPMTDYTVFIESTVLSSVHQLTTSEMTPVASGAHYCTYHVSIPANNLQGASGNEFWLIAQCANKDYTNFYGVPNGAGADKLTAFFRSDLFVGPGNNAPVINGITDNLAPEGLNTTITQADTSVNYSVNYTDSDSGQSHVIKWYIEDGHATSPTDPPDTMPFNWAAKSPGQYKIWVTVDDGFGPVSAGPYSVTRILSKGWAYTWGGGLDTDGCGNSGYCVTTDSYGNMYIGGGFSGTNVDFDPGPGQDLHTSDNGYPNPFVCKFDPNGVYVWGRSWGSTGYEVDGVAVDKSGNVYTCGEFGGTDVDFDPGPGTDLHSSHGSIDAFFLKLDSSGNFVWAYTWGGSNFDYAEDLAIAPSGDILVSGEIKSANVDLDPTGGVDIHSASGEFNSTLSKFTPSGAYKWGLSWGGSSSCGNGGIAVDSTGCIDVIGGYENKVDFDPGPGQDIHTSAGGEDVFLSQFNSSGVHQWTKTWGEANSDYNWDDGIGVAVDNSGSIITSGVFEGTCDFDPGRECRPEHRTAAMTPSWPNTARPVLSNGCDHGAVPRRKWPMSWRATATETSTRPAISRRPSISIRDPAPAYILHPATRPALSANSIRREYSNGPESLTDQTRPTASELSFMDQVIYMSPGHMPDPSTSIRVPVPISTRLTTFLEIFLS